MTKPTNEELEQELKTLETNYRQAIQVQENCKNRFIAINAILADRKKEEEEEEDN